MTLQRSREFDVESVTRWELRAIADTVRQRFHQQSVLTFDYPDRRSDPVDAVKLEVPGSPHPSAAGGLRGRQSGRASASWEDR